MKKIMLMAVDEILAVVMVFASMFSAGKYAEE